MNVYTEMNEPISSLLSANQSVATISLNIEEKHLKPDQIVVAVFPGSAMEYQADLYDKMKEDESQFLHYMGRPDVVWCYADCIFKGVVSKDAFILVLKKKGA